MDLETVKKRNRAFLLLLLTGFVCYLLLEWVIYMFERDQVEWVTVDPHIEQMIEKRPTAADGLNTDADPSENGAAYGAGRNKIDINTATVSELETLNGIGPVKAREIVEHRERHGPFQSIDQIKDVKGIGEATFTKIKDDIMVDSNTLK